MADIIEERDWSSAIYEIAMTDDVIGGPGGISNRQATQLASRTNFLKDHVDSLENGDTASGAAKKLETARTIALSGDVIGSVSFDGSANVSMAVTYKTTGVVAGSYRQVDVDVKGNVTGGSNPTTLASYGITDAAPKNSPSLTGVPTAPTPSQFDVTTKIATMEAVQRALGNYRGSLSISANSVLDVQHIGMRIVAGASATALTFTMPQMSALTNGATITFQNLSGKPIALVQASVTDRFMSLFDSSGIALTYTLPIGGEVTATVYGSGSTWLIGGVGDFFNAQFRSGLNPNGWKRIPDPNSPTGYMLLQWGACTAAGGYDSTFNFPASFNYACHSLVLTSDYTQNSGSVATMASTPISNSQFVTRASTDGPFGAKFIATGY